MPKAADLDIDLNEPSHLPPAATAPRKTPRVGKAIQHPKNDTPVNFRWPETEVKAMKRAALDADLSIQDFMLSCFHAFMKTKKN